MLLTKFTNTKWNAKNKKYYVDLGYEFTKMNESFLVKVQDLKNSSCSIIEVKCDYCGKVFKTKWNTYKRLKDKDIIYKDCCGNKECTTAKSKEVLKEKYNVYSCRELDWVNEKIKNTNIKKYGVENPFQNEEIKRKIKESNIDKYGTEYPSQNKEIMNKIINTYEKRTGKKWKDINKGKIKENSNAWKGGVKVHKIERCTFEYYQWRKNVFQKNNYTCQKCKERSRKGNPIKINAHHIKNWKDYPESRYDINNGVTLCEKCHIEFHSIYGKRNNNQYQLEEFLNN